MKKTITLTLLATLSLAGCSTVSAENSAPAPASNLTEITPTTDTIAETLGCETRSGESEDSKYDCGELLLTDWEGYYTDTSDLQRQLDNLVANGFAQDAVAIGQVSVSGPTAEVNRAREALDLPSKSHALVDVGPPDHN